MSFLLLFACLQTAAKEVEQGRSLQAASRFVTGYSAGLRSASPLQLVYTATKADASGLRSAARPLFYIYNVGDGDGFVAVSGDDIVAPILAFADKGGFNATSMPSNLRLWLQGYEKEIAYSIAKGDTASAKVRKEWEGLLTGTPSVNEKATVLLPTVEWDQMEPYNNLCPIDSGITSPTGCVATAMGIIMKYYEWPANGVGSNSYSTNTNKIRLHENFNVTYNWSNMLDKYEYNRNKPNWNGAQGSAVATLLYHCGVASYMDYGHESSGTSEWDAVAAMINNFGYDKSLYLARRDLYTKSEWDKLLQEELNEGRPLLYGGVTSNLDEGHQFVIDGYSPNYYHVNWGWGGWSNGFYRLNSLDPDNNDNRDGDGYAIGQDAVIGLQKAMRNSRINNELYFAPGGEFDFFGLDTDVDFITANNPFKIRFSFVLDYGERAFDGQMGFFVVDKAGNRKITLEIFDFSLKAGYVVYDSDGETYTVNESIAEGDKIRLYYRPTGHDWKPVRGTSATVVELPLSVDGPLPPTQTSVESIKDIPQQVTVSLVSDILDIRSTQEESIREISLYNLSGRQLKHEKYGSNEWHVSILTDNLPAGIYVVTVQTLHGITTHKIVKH
ncbi:hypothetical protein AGMMS49574_02300 [Bacteroidia bacterium]|nr:hypothetical protein AGMMS49574_02300 [Bacteroidia bacterium]